MMLRKNSLVLYKRHPARVLAAGDKLEIEVRGSGIRKVRPKDVELLHPGPLQSLSELNQDLAGEADTAWELLAGETTNLGELAELIHGEFTPPTAWATWQLVSQDLYFGGNPNEIVARTAEEIEREEQRRSAKLAAEQAWTAFIGRLQLGQTAPEDAPFIAELEKQALGQQSKHRILHELGRAESPENAHALLLQLKYWDSSVVPYARRQSLPTNPPTLDLPELPAEERLDLTHLETFAIDDAGNQDPDDALSFEGGRLWVHIADVAALVTPDSAADIEARDRGANLYLPDGTVPMLPPQATQMLGLGLAPTSPALSFGMDLDSDYKVSALEIVPSWIQVNRLTYEEAEARLDEEPLRSLHDLAQTMQGERWANDAVFIEWPEFRILVADGRVAITPLPTLHSRDLVMEAMLMTGEAIARFALAHQIPIPFSTQDPPTEAEIPPGLAGMFARRRTLKRSQLRSTQAPHAGLGLEVYSQATSPLRRYMDLVVHQQIRAYIRGQDLLGDQEVLERVGRAESISGSVRQTERLSNRHWSLVYLLEHPAWQGKGILVDKRQRRGTVLVEGLGLETQVHLPTDIPLNSTLSLTLSGIDLPRLEAHFIVEA